MIHIKSFTFNPFSENTYVLYDESNDCIIIDPGCSHKAEENELVQFIEDHHLKPVRLLNTHCHIDHILGNKFISEKYGLPLEAHELETDNVRRADSYAAMFGMDSLNTPSIAKYLNEGDDIIFGHSRLQVLFTPGHAPGHVVFYDPLQQIVIGGDVLFRESIGRTDLPGGDFNTLIQSIQHKLFVLDDNVVVYSGHGPETTIGYEKQYNPFLQEALS
jgi:hydroxyacylglutathione hydrolase